jgi:SAM-dependent methyltransferase
MALGPSEPAGRRAGPPESCRGGVIPLFPRLSLSILRGHLEIGSGTGILTPYLQEVWNDVVCVDLSMNMISRGHIGCRVQADASRLPFPDASFDAIVIGDAPLFAGETLRVLAPSASLIWSNALGSGAPYHLPTGDIWGAVVGTTPGSEWSAVESEALWGSWVVFHRSEVPSP